MGLQNNYISVNFNVEINVEIMSSLFNECCTILSTYHNFNGTPGDLSWDLQGLEEASLLRPKAGVLAGNGHRAWSNSASTSRSLLLVSQQLVTHIHQVFVGENKAHIVDNMRKKPVRKSILLMTFCILITPFHIMCNERQL